MTPLARFACISLAAATLCAANSQTFKYHQIKSEKPEYWSAKGSYISEGGTAVQKFAAKAIENEVKQIVAQFVSEMNRQVSDLGRPTSPLSLELKPVLSVAVGAVVSGYLEHYEYTGGAHPNTTHHPFVFALRAGKPARLHLSEVLVPEASIRDLESRVILPKLNDAKKARGMEPLGALPSGTSESFFASSNGLTWIFSPYAVGAYVEGTYIIKATWAELDSFLSATGPLKPLLGRTQ